MYWDKCCAYIGVIGGLLSSALGGFDLMIKVLISVMVIDIITGFTAAGVFKKSKYNNGGISSDALFKGSMRKIAMLIMVMLAVFIDLIMDFDYVRNGTVLYFIATDGLSIIENMDNIGVPIPKFLKRLLQSMEEENNEIV